MLILRALLSIGLLVFSLQPCQIQFHHITPVLQKKLKLKQYIYIYIYMYIYIFVYI